MKNILLILALIFVCPFCFQVYSQDTISRQGFLEINQDSRLDQLVKKHVKLNEHFNNIIGYRIQIFFESGTNSKKLAMDTRAAFMINHPEADAYILYEEPHYKVRVGDFRTKLEAEGFLNEIIVEYPGAFVTKDEIKFPKLKYTD